MVRFTRQSTATIKLPSKPVPKGFKIISLYQYGYYYSFIFTSPSYFFRLPSRTDHQDIVLSNTSKCVLYLTQQLPLQAHRFCLFLDNYFINVPLLQALQQLRIATAGTAQSNLKDYPEVYKRANKRKERLPFNFITGVVVGVVNSVLLII
jgi:hypothetical protein